MPALVQTVVPPKLRAGDTVRVVAPARSRTMDSFESDAAHVARQLTSLLQLPDADGVTGLVVGRFQASSGVTREALDEIVARQPALRGKPVVAGVDFGHTSPLLTFPVGGTAELAVADDGASLTITRH